MFSDQHHDIKIASEARKTVKSTIMKNRKKQSDFMNCLQVFGAKNTEK
jgi:hypothetical protein